MSANLPRFQSSAPDPAKTLDTLATVLITVLVIGILYFAREILVPIAIAVVLSFVLSPLVRVLRKVGLGRTLSVGLVVFATLLLAIGVGMVLAKQVSDLAADAPQYQATVIKKVDKAKAFTANNPLLNKLNTLIADASRMGSGAKSGAEKPKPAIFPPKSPPRTEPQAETKPANPAPASPVPVEIVSPPPGVFTVLQAVAGTAASPLATAAFVSIFVVFILLQREDLRNRFIRLVGSGDMQRTTLAMNDAARRLSRYFLAQMLLNTGFGIMIAIMLSLIGVPSALVWGIVAIFLRFIPYVGSFGAAILPLLMAAAASPGWTMVIETALLFVVSESIVGQVVEPLVYGRNTGISPIAVVAAATFWTWLWGPIGLVLSTPLTVCVVVIGRHVERLAFLDVILGDDPALTPVETFYQRMLVGDPSEIVDHAETFLREGTLLDYYDEVAMKALLLAQVDANRGALPEQKQTTICQMIQVLLEDLADNLRALEKPLDPKTAEPPASLELGDEADEADGRKTPPLPSPRIDPAWRENAVLCVAGRSLLDEAAAYIFADLLRCKGVGVRVMPSTSLTSDDPAGLANPATRLVVLSMLDADLNVAQARFAVRRLRRRVPNVPVVAAFWRVEADEKHTLALCSDVRCDICVSSLPDAVRLCLDKAEEKAVAEAA